MDKLAITARPTDSFAPIRSRPPAGIEFNTLSQLGAGLQQAGEGILKLGIRRAQDAKDEAQRTAQAAAAAVPAGLLEENGWADTRKLAEHLKSKGYDNADDVVGNIYFQQLVGRRVVETGDLFGSLQGDIDAITDPIGKQSVESQVDGRIQKWIETRGLTGDENVEFMLGASNAIAAARNNFVQHANAVRKEKQVKEEIQTSSRGFAEGLDQILLAKDTISRAGAVLALRAQAQARSGTGLKDTDALLYEALQAKVQEIALDFDEETAVEEYHRLMREPLLPAPGGDKVGATSFERTRYGQGDVETDTLGKIRRAANLANEEKERKRNLDRAHADSALLDVMAVFSGDLGKMEGADLALALNNIQEGLGQKVYQDMLARAKASGFEGTEAEFASHYLRARETLVTSALRTKRTETNESHYHELQALGVAGELTLEAIQTRTLSTDHANQFYGLLRTQKARGDVTDTYISEMQAIAGSFLDARTIAQLGDDGQEAQASALRLVSDYKRAAENQEPDVQQKLAESAFVKLEALKTKTLESRVLYDFDRTRAAVWNFEADKDRALKELLADVERSGDIPLEDSQQARDVVQIVSDLIDESYEQVLESDGRQLFSQIKESGAPRQGAVQNLQGVLARKAYQRAWGGLKDKLKLRAETAALTAQGEAGKGTFAGTPEKILNLPAAVMNVHGSLIRTVPGADIPTVVSDHFTNYLSARRASLWDRVPAAADTLLDAQIAVALVGRSPELQRWDLNSNLFGMDAVAKADTRKHLRGLLVTRGFTLEEAVSGKSREGVQLNTLFGGSFQPALAATSFLTAKQTYEAEDAESPAGKAVQQLADRLGLKVEQIIETQRNLWDARRRAVTEGLGLTELEAEKYLESLNSRPVKIRGTADKAWNAALKEITDAVR